MHLGILAEHMCEPSRVLCKSAEKIFYYHRKNNLEREPIRFVFSVPWNKKRSLRAVNKNWVIVGWNWRALELAEWELWCYITCLLLFNFSVFSSFIAGFCGNRAMNISLLSSFLCGFKTKAHLFYATHFLSSTTNVTFIEAKYLRNSISVQCLCGIPRIV